MENQGVDRVSDLPVGILHNVLCFLPTEDAPKTSVLSKRWQYVWNSYPVFDFCPIRDKRSNLSSRNRIYYLYDENEATKRYIDMVECRLKSFCKLNFSIHKVKFRITHYLTTKFKSLLDKWMRLILEKHVKELEFSLLPYHKIDYCLPQTVFIARSLTALRIVDINLELDDDVTSTINLPSLRTLSLCHINTSDKTVQHLVRSCPSLEKLKVMYIKGIQVLNLFGMAKLHTIELAEITRAKLSNCRALKRAYFYHTMLDCVFDDQNFPEIEFISLSDCAFPRGIKISSQQLKTLVLKSQNFDNKCEIVAPNLSSIELVYSDCKSKPVLEDFGHAITSISKLKAQYELNVFLFVDRENLGTPWFIKFKEILKLQTTTKTLDILTISPWDIQTVTFDKEEEALICYSPPYTLEHMTLMVESSDEETKQLDFAALLDGFLWCCHPKTLSVTTDFEYSRKFLKFLCEILEEEMDEQVSSRKKCWRHALRMLKDITLESPEGIKVKVPFCKDALLKAAQNNGEETEEVKVHFDLILDNLQ